MASYPDAGRDGRSQRAIFTWQSGDATPKIARYCVVADFVICAVLCANLAGHWILAREVSADGGTLVMAGAIRVCSTPWRCRVRRFCPVTFYQ